MAINSDSSFDQLLVSPAIFSDPYPIYHQLRAQSPVHWSEAWGCWVLTRYADVIAVLRDYRRFTNVGRIASFLDQLPASVRAQIRPLYDNFTVGMPNTDPPEHTRVRGLVNKAFSARVVESMRPRVQAIVDGLLDQAESGGSMEVIGELAYPLPAIVIAETLGVPAADRDQFKAWSDDIVAFHGTGRPHIETIKKSTAALLETKAWLLQLIEARRRQPEDDLISALVAAEERGRHAQPDRTGRHLHHAADGRSRDDHRTDRERAAGAAAPSGPVAQVEGESDHDRNGGGGVSALRHLVPARLAPHRRRCQDRRQIDSQGADYFADVGGGEQGSGPVRKSQPVGYHARAEPAYIFRLGHPLLRRRAACPSRGRDRLHHAAAPLSAAETGRGGCGMAEE